MTNTFHKYPKIRQFRDIVQDVKHYSELTGVDDEGNPVYNILNPKPLIIFTGTTKVHGTNAGIYYNWETEELRAQQRNSFCDDNAHYGFKEWVKENEKLLKDYIFNYFDNSSYVPLKEITLYGEWAGVGIQNGVGVSKLPKFFYLTDIYYLTKLTNLEGFVDKVGLNLLPGMPGIRLYNSEDFRPRIESIAIDFNKPELAIEALEELTLRIENECPVAKQLGAEGKLIGEGIVWSARYKGKTLTFKTKGPKHHAPGVKKIVAISPEVTNSVTEFVDLTVNERRLEQALHEVIGAEIPTAQHLGKFLGWVGKDVKEEEIDTLTAAGLDWSHVKKAIPRKAKDWYLEYLNKRTFNLEL